MPAAAASLSPDPPHHAPPAGTPLSPVTLARACAHAVGPLSDKQRMGGSGGSGGGMDTDALDREAATQGPVLSEPALESAHTAATSSPTQTMAKLEPLAAPGKQEAPDNARMDGQEDYQSEPQTGAAPILPVLDAIMAHAMETCQAAAREGDTGVVINADDSESSGDDEDDANSAATPHAKREGRVAPSSMGSARESIRFTVGSTMEDEGDADADADADADDQPIAIPGAIRQQQLQQQLQQQQQQQGKKHVRVSCHQCKTTKDDGLLLFCTTKAEKGKRKRKCRKKYCDACLRRSYNMSISSLSPAEIGSYCCPACKGTCSCAACQRKQLESMMRKEQSRATAASATSFPAARAAAAAASTTNPFGFNPLFNMNSFLSSLALAQTVPATATPATAATATADLSGVAAPPTAASTATMQAQALAAIQAMRASGITIPFLQQTAAAAAAATTATPASTTPSAASPAVPPAATDVSQSPATATAAPAAATPSTTEHESIKSAHALMAQLLQVYTNASAAAAQQQQQPQPSSSPSAQSVASASPGGASSAASTVSATAQLSKSMAKMNASASSAETALTSPTPSFSSASGNGSGNGGAAESNNHTSSVCPPPINVAAANSSISGNTSILIKSYEELAALSPKSLARQQAAAAAAAATTQAEIEEKTRQLQELLARRMSQDPAFLANFNRATGANLQAPIATHMHAGDSGDGQTAAQIGIGSMDEASNLKEEQEPVHDDLHSNSPTPPSVVWTDAQFQAHQREQQRALLKLEKQLAQRAQMTQQSRNALSMPAKTRTLGVPGAQSQSHGGAPLSAHVVQGHARGMSAAEAAHASAVSRQVRAMSGSAVMAVSNVPTGKGLERIERNPATRPVKAPRASSTNPDAPGRIYKRKNGASSPYARPADAAAQAARRMSPSQALFDHSSAPSSLQASPSIHARTQQALMDMEDEDVLMDEELRRQLAASAHVFGPSHHHQQAAAAHQQQRPQQQRHARGSSDGRDNSSSTPQTLSPSDPNYHRFLQKRLQQQQHQHEQELHQSSYNQRLMQAHKILIEQNRSVRASISHQHQQHQHQQPATRPLHGHGGSRHDEMGLASVDVHYANQNYQQQQYSSSTVAAGALFSPLPGAGGQQQIFSPQASHAHSSGFFTPPPMPGSNEISPDSQSGLALPAPLSIGGLGGSSSVFNPLGSPSASDFAGQSQQYQQHAHLHNQSSATYTPLALQTPSSAMPHQQPHQQLHMPGHYGMHGMLSSPTIPNQPGSFLFTPLAPQTPSIFINHGALGAITGSSSGGAGDGIGSGGSSSGSHQQFDWSQAQPGNVGMVNGGGSARSASSGGKLNLLQATSSPVGQINGSSILGMLSPTPGVLNGAGGNSSPSLPPNFGLSAMPMSPTEGLPQLPTASP